MSDGSEVLGRDALLLAVIQSTRALHDCSSIDEGIANALSILGEAAGAQHILLFKNHRDRQTGAPLMSLRAAWASTRAAPGVNDRDFYDLRYESDQSAMYSQLAKAGHAAGAVDDLGLGAQPWIKSIGAASALLLPVFARTSFWGHLGIYDARRGHRWTGDEIAILRNAADSLGGALDRRRQEKQLNARDRILQGVSLATNGLLSAPTIESGVQHALQVLGEAASVERAYIFENESDAETGGRLMSGRYVWTHPSTAGAADISRLQHLSYETLFPRWYETLEAGRTISGRVTDFLRPPSRAAGGDTLRTILLVPIMIENRFWGLLGFDDGNLERNWLQADESILQAVAGSLGVAIARLRAQEALHESEERFRQAQKMEAIGRLAGGVAHDFNNLLTAIMGYGELMLNKLAASDPMHHEVQEICRAADRAHSLTRQLLAFSRKQVLEPKVLNLNSVISELEKLLRRLIGEDVDLVTELDHEISMVRVDQSQIEQVVINLAVNARDAMPDGGQLTIRTYNADIVKRVTRGHAFVEPGSYVAISVTDTGQGMDAFVQARIFEPFFTTKEVGKGTGLGLSMIYGIVQQSKGYIMFESEKEKGARFTIYLPQVEQLEPAPHLAGTKKTAGGYESILLVEDEDVVRDLAVRILRDQGYRMLSARNGKEALGIIESGKESIDLILTDIVMPQMSGRVLAQRVRQLDPELKVLYMSGYAAEETMHGETDLTNFIQKPFTPALLARKVREVLDAT